MSLDIKEINIYVGKKVLTRNFAYFLSTYFSPLFSVSKFFYNFSYQLKTLCLIYKFIGRKIYSVSFYDIPPQMRVE